MTRPIATTGGPSRPASRGEGTQTYPHTEIIRMPSGSIVQIASFEPLDPAPSGLYRGIMLALPVSLFLWGFIFAAVWRLSSFLF